MGGLVFFILSPTTTSPGSSGDMERIADAFGEPIGGSRSTFPGPGVLGRESALVGLEELNLGLGKGMKIGWAAGEILSGRLDLESLVREPSHRLVTDRLKAIHGVGDKVANCVALFSLERLGLISCGRSRFTFIGSPLPGHPQIPRSTSQMGPTSIRTVRRLCRCRPVLRRFRPKQREDEWSIGNGARISDPG